MSTVAANPPAALISVIANQCELGVATELTLLTDSLKDRFGDSLLAVILYGSCLRADQYVEGVVDLYVIVTTYKEAYTQTSLRCLNAWLPPNVFYLEVEFAGTKLRAKYAVISANDMQRGCSRWYHSYVWSRFAQPTRILHARDTTTREQLYHDFARAVLTFLSTTLPVLGPATVDTETIWNNGLGLTYAAELRPERHTRAREITHQNLDDFTMLTSSAAAALSDVALQLPQNRYQCLADGPARKHALRQWRIRRWQGLVLSVLRLVKAVFTFHDSVSYAAWKIERHTGISIEVTPELRRHPVLFGFRVLWQLIKRDVMH